MSISISSLSKQFGTQWAVDHIDLEVAQGEIIGFLGPNGAGKSTTMKMLTCFLEPTSGTARVNGYDIKENSLDVRRSVGYLPEHNPLYKEMYIREYLQIAAKVHQLSQPKSRVEQIMERTGLGPEQNKRIGQLSKGYRQRVGLAQAMLHDPQVLILDEPTSGLDPNQLVEIRQLIKDIGKEKTVLFSSHIMQEVQALCDRVVIINKGKLVADESIDELPNLVKEQDCYDLGSLTDGELEILSRMPNCDRIVSSSAGGHIAYFPKNQIDGKDIFKYCMSRNIVLERLHKQETSVEDVFQSLTQPGS